MVGSSAGGVMQNIYYDGTDQEVLFSASKKDYSGEYKGSTNGELLAGVTVALYEAGKKTVMVASPLVVWDSTLQKWKLTILADNLTQYGYGILTINGTAISTTTIEIYAGSDLAGSDAMQEIKNDGTDQEVHFNITILETFAEFVGAEEGEVLTGATVAIREYKKATVTISSPVITWDSILQKWKLTIPASNITQYGSGIITIQRTDLVTATISYYSRYALPGYTPSIEIYPGDLSGPELIRRLNFVTYLEQKNDAPVGFEWDTAFPSSTLKIIDVNGNTITPSPTFWNNHSIWGSFTRVARNRTTGVFTPGDNNRGDGLSLRGSMGDIFVKFRNARYKFGSSGTKRRFLFMPFTADESKYPPFPNAVARGGVARPYMYVAAFEGSLWDDNGILKLGSVGNAQPWTGGEIKSLNFSNGLALQADETVSGATSNATGIVVGYHITSGSLTNGDAVGKMYLRQISGTFQSGETLNGNKSGTSCVTTTSTTSTISVTLDGFEGYANAVCSGAGVCNLWTRRYLTLLMAMECGTWDIQSVLGKGIVDLAIGTSGYLGRLTGADSVAGNLDENGTGAGNGIDGQTPYTWRCFENLSGNINEVIAGLNVLSDGTVRTLKLEGHSDLVIPSVLTSYDVADGKAALSDGFISDILTDLVGGLGLIPSSTNGFSGKYIGDKYVHPANAISIGRVGGNWADGVNAGPYALDLGAQSTTSVRTTGARVEIVPQE